jgi:hypothetical protein
VDRDGVFHIYGNDQRRGFDVYRVDLTGGAENATTSGRDGWLTPEELEVRVGALPAVDLTDADVFRCLLPPA